MKRKQGALTVLALLLSVLLSQGAVASAAELDTRSSRLAPTDATKLTLTLRSVSRGQSEEADTDPLLAQPPSVSTRIVATRPIALGVVALDSPLPPRTRIPYQARAPPAA